jgi:hypothetical protein
MDAVAIQWTMGGLLALSLHATTSVPLWVTCLPLPGLWLMWWAFAHHVDRNTAIAAQGVPVLVAVGFTAGVWQAGVTLVLILAALALQKTGGTHSLKHTLWHVLSAAAITLSAIFLLA